MKTCPYAEGTDILKFHYLWMPEKQAKEMDKRIEAAKGPVCGQPINPGSCMCKEHMRFSRGYKERPVPYPVDGKNFTCHHSPTDYCSEKRWICHDKDQHLAAEFETEDEAKQAVDLWNKHGAEKITMDWKNSEEDADDSDRGTYIIALEGTRYRETIRCGWHSMEAAARRAQALRNALVKHGVKALIDILTGGR